jgi:hypothetical protein
MPPVFCSGYARKLRNLNIHGHRSVVNSIEDPERQLSEITIRLCDEGSGKVSSGASAVASQPRKSKDGDSVSRIDDVAPGGVGSAAVSLESSAPRVGRGSEPRAQPSTASEPSQLKEKHHNQANVAIGRNQTRTLTHEENVQDNDTASEASTGSGPPRPIKMAYQCSFWDKLDHPRHKRPCKFYHPSKTCDFYPNCKYGAYRCIYGHPFCTAAGEKCLCKGRGDDQLHHLFNKERIEEAKMSKKY